MEKSREMLFLVAEQFHVPPMELLEYPIDLYEDMIDYLYQKVVKAKDEQAKENLRRRFRGGV